MDFNILLSNIGLEEFIALDLETSGLNANSDKIIEISAYKFIKGVPVESFTYLINPEIQINHTTTKITGITNQMLSNAKTFNQIQHDFQIFIGQLPIVGHNILFDLSFLKKYLNNYDFLFKNRMICDTFYLSKIFYYYTNSFSLISLCSFKNIEISESHRAEQDAKNSGLLFVEILTNEIQYSNAKIIQKLNNVIKSFDVPNKKLFNNILSYFLKRKNITKEKKTIQDAYSKFYLEYKSKSKIHKKYKIDDIFEDNGLIEKALETYEKRNNQIKFSLDIYNALDSDDLLIAEAGAGLGKSYAYLFASLLYLQKDKKQIVISTNTHALQNQLFDKDIPFVLDILDQDCKVAIIKGINNYICLTRFNDLLNNIDNNLNKYEVMEILPIVFWLDNTVSGDISECNGFNIRNYNYLWLMINSKSDYCTTFRCDLYKGCYYRKIKELSMSSDLLIVNHSMLVSYHDKYDSIINDNSICIIDECHNFPSIAQKQLTIQIDINLFNEQKKTFLKITESNNQKKMAANISNKINIIKDLYSDFLDDFNFSCSEFYDLNVSGNLESEYIQNITLTEDINFINFSNMLKVLSEKYDKIIENINNYKEILEETNNNKNIIQALALFLKNLESTSILLDDLRKKKNNKINWFSYRNFNKKLDKLSFSTAPSNLETTSNEIFKKFSSMILCSATLCTDSGFSYFIRQMGLKDREYNDKIKMLKYSSPYFYSDQSKLFIINTSMDLSFQDHIKKVANDILDINRKTNKRMLVLCTSFKQIYEFESYINAKIDKNDNFLYQNKGISKNILLSEYLKNKNSVLFGTNTFWEGVDLPEKKLEILILFKLPFANPKDPYINANIEYYKSKNLDPFSNYQLEETVLKLKQGFGRLIRSYTDMGVCIITDPRLSKRRYGKYVVDSLPVEPTYYSSSGLLVEEISNFLK